MEDKEMIYQEEIEKVYKETQEFGRIDFVKAIVDLKEEIEKCKLADFNTYVTSQEITGESKAKLDNLKKYIEEKIEGLKSIVNANYTMGDALFNKERIDTRLTIYQNLLNKIKEDSNA